MEPITIIGAIALAGFLARMAAGNAEAQSLQDEIEHDNEYHEKNLPPLDLAPEPTPQAILGPAQNVPLELKQRDAELRAAQRDAEIRAAQRDAELREQQGQIELREQQRETERLQAELQSAQRQAELQGQLRAAELRVAQREFDLEAQQRRDAAAQAELQGQQRLDALRQAQLRQQADLVNLQTAQRQLDALRDAELDDQRRQADARVAETKRQAKINEAAQVQYDADQEGVANPQPTQRSEKKDIEGDGFEEGAHGNAIIVGNYNPTPPPDPGRQDRIIRFFVFDTQDEPIPPGGQAVIQRRWNIVANWVTKQAGRAVAFHPKITYLRLNKTSYEIRHMVLSSSALGAGSINKFDHYQGVEGRRGPLYNKPRVAARQWVPPSYSGGMVQYVFDEMAKYAIATNQPLNNPHNESLRPLKQTWVFLVRGAGGYAAGHAYRSTDRTVMGWGFGGDAMLGAWLSDTGLEKNLAHEMIFIGDKEGRDEWEEGWRKENISNTLHSRLYWGSADAQTGSFIHEIYHGAFDSIHVANLKEVSEGLNDKVRRRMVSRQRADAMLQLFIQDPMGGMLAGGHLDWPKPGSRLNPVTLAEMVDTPLWA